MDCEVNPEEDPYAESASNVQLTSIALGARPGGRYDKRPYRIILLITDYHKTKYFR